MERSRPLMGDTLTDAEALRFRYRAADQRGAIARGTVTARNADDARNAIRHMNLMPLELHAEEAQHAHRAAISSAQLAMGLRILADLIDAGLPINRALATFEGLAPPQWKPAIPSLQGAIREGRSLGHALREAPIAIPPLVMGIVIAGEAGSGLAPAIRRAGDIMESVAATRAAVRAALAYPIILAVAGVSSIGLLVGMVLPRFATILGDLGQALPPATQLLIRSSLLAQASFLPLTLAAFAIACAWYVWTRTENGLRMWHRVLLNVPVCAPLRFSLASSRACIALSTLLTSGVPLPSALTHAARATGDAEVSARLLSAREAITRGDSLARAVESSNALTATTARLIGAGEYSGRLPEMLLHAGKIEQDLADRALRAGVRMLEPILVLVFAAIVGMVAAALLQAVYSVRPNA